MTNDIQLANATAAFAWAVATNKKGIIEAQEGIAQAEQTITDIREEARVRALVARFKANQNPTRENVKEDWDAYRHCVKVGAEWPCLK